MPDQSIGPEKKSLPSQESNPLTREQQELRPITPEDPKELSSEMPTSIEYPLQATEYTKHESPRTQLDRSQETDVKERVTHIFLWHDIDGTSCGEVFSQCDPQTREQVLKISNPLREKIVDCIIEHQELSSPREAEIRFFHILKENNAFRNLLYALFPHIKKEFIEQEIKRFAEKISEALYPELYVSLDNAIAT
ncbi:MAG TPA: hypothetical protein VJB93_00390 [Patescibacteria group bacterium]|nr:hypothetical protein [Patescibacteria group bacterium]